MKKLFYLVILFALFSCKKKNPTQADYMHRALVSDSYRVVLTDLNRVKDSLDLAKKRPIDTITVIYEYNMIGGIPKTEAKTISQVKEAMEKYTDFLKAVQVNIANKMAKDHQDSVSTTKP